MKAPRIAALRLVAVAGLAAALLAGCASTRLPEPAPAPAPVAQRAGDEPSQQAAVAAPRAYCPGPGFEAAAQRNAASLRSLEFAPFGRPEHGWEIYAPAIAQQIGSECPPETAQFAQRLAAWEGARGLPANGVVDAASFAVLKSAMQGRRPFLKIRGDGLCPDSPDEMTLAQASPLESRWDKPVKLRPGALIAYRRMVAAAKREAPQAFVDGDLLKIFSAFRSPVSDDARCASEGNCQGLVRAACSAHRTGLAMDINVGHAPGSRADASEDSNRLYQSRTAIYRWLVVNAARFGFVNYPFEPWHWEWTGETMTASAAPRRPQTTAAAPTPLFAQAAQRTYAAPPGAMYATNAPGAPTASEPRDPVAALLTPASEEGGQAGSGRTFAQSLSEAPRPPRPESPADPGPPGW